MITVAILGKKTDRRITDYLIRAFDGLCPSLFLTPFGTIRTQDEDSSAQSFDPLIIFWDSESTDVNFVPDIVILKDSCEHLDVLLKDNTTMIFNSVNASHLDAVRGTSVNAIACGYTQRDAITFSSVLPEEPVLALQRSVHALDGTEVEPFELPIEVSAGWGRYPLQSVFALLILLGTPNRVHYIFDKHTEKQ